MLAKLSHPHVVAIHDVGLHVSVDTDEEVFLAMELVKGRTLTEWLAAGPHPWREVLRVVTDAGSRV